jgi:hypothetical protein
MLLLGNSKLTSKIVKFSKIKNITKKYIMENFYISKNIVIN